MKLSMVGAVLGAAMVLAGACTPDAAQPGSGSPYGVDSGIGASSTQAISLADATADPLKLATFAPGLSARVVTSGVAAQNIDQMALWPDATAPTHLIGCNEQGATDPGLQRIDIATGATDTIVTGTSACDGVRATAWGTIMFSEENGGGAAGGSVYELIDPLGTTGVSLDRVAGTFSGGTGAANLVRRTSLGKASFEGHGLLPNGVMYFGDENRPSSGVAGGAYFKFVPSTPWVSGTVSSLSQSPLAAGRIVGFRAGLRSGGTDYCKGTQTGLGKWLPICDDAGATVCTNFDLRAAAATNKLTGYYRPEDLEVDPGALADGNVKVCGPNTGNEADDHNWGETICMTDGTVATSLANTATPEMQLFVIGNADQAMMDNIAYRPGKKTWVIHEDGDIGASLKNNDLFSCLADGADVDTLSDGCLKIATLNDTSSPAHTEGAEWTGGIFDATGTRFFVSVQHNITGKGVVLEVTGWK